MLLNEGSENAELYQPQEKQELLYCIFRHLCLGGAVNQFEVRFVAKDVKCEVLVVCCPTL